MDMGTMTSSGSAAMTGMSMGMPTDSSMSMNSSMMMGMDSMAMVFFTSNQTPLYSWSWSPTTDGQYAGTCIFLIAFAALFRALLAIRVHFFPILAAFRRRHGQHFDNMVLLDEKTIARRPWRANEAVMVAFLDMILAGVSYLLMLAVMTMNVGYFLSILVGVFVGSLAFGHYTANSAAH